MKNPKTGRFLVILEKVTFPDGTVKTLPSVPSSIERSPISPRNLGRALLELQDGYEKMVKAFRYYTENLSSEKRFAEMISAFLKRAKKLNVRVRGLGTSLFRDVGIPTHALPKILERGQYVRGVVNYIAKWNKKGKKNAVKYAEAVEELVDLAGSYEGAVAMLSGKTEIGDSTVQGWCKVAGMPDEVKGLISEGKLPPTTAFMIPTANVETEIEIAEAISGLPQSTAKKVLKYIETHPEIPPHEAKAKVLG